MSDSAASNLDSTVGRMIVEKGLATAEEVQECIDRARQKADVGSLTDVLLEKGVVTQRQLSRLKPEVEEQRAGRQIPGYQILGKLGAGAMATVYQARQLSLDRDGGDQGAAAEVSRTTRTSSAGFMTRAARRRSSTTPTSCRPSTWARPANTTTS